MIDLDRIFDRLDGINACLADMSREIGEISSRVGMLERSHERLNQILVDNNGRAIVPRVVVIESTLERTAAALEKLSDDIRELDETKISGDLPGAESELAKVELAREETAKKRWDALKPLLVAAPGLFAAIAYAVDWLKKHGGQ